MCGVHERVHYILLMCTEYYGRLCSVGRRYIESSQAISKYSETPNSSATIPCETKKEGGRFTMDDAIREIQDKMMMMFGKLTKEQKRSIVELAEFLCEICDDDDTDKGRSA